MAVREERDKIEQRQRKRTGRRPGGGQTQAPIEAMTDDEGDGATESKATPTRATADDLDYSSSAVLNSESLMLRKMEQYDSLLDEMSLPYSLFTSSSLEN